MVSAVLVVLVRAYQRTLGALLPQRCRFYPSCSEYAIGAIRARGPVVGPALAAWRVLRCGPWSAGGIDRPPHAHIEAVGVRG